MSLISKTDDLAAFCARHRDAPYLLIDTEFLREQTYYPKLCLVQIAGPEEALVIDALAPDLDLDVLRPLLSQPDLVKVFHAGRQDLEIFFHRFGFVPTPLFDTQLAAMVCGYGEQVAMDTLVRRITGTQLDKMSRFTDWTRRPLSKRQHDYALSDVLLLRPVYLALSSRLEEQGRGDWIAAEIEALTDPGLYHVDPDQAWRRIKVRSNDLKFLGRLKALAAWREAEAQRRDLPRQRLLKDEQLQEIASHNPSDAEGLAHARGISPEMARGRFGQRLLATLAEAQPLDRSERPPRPDRPSGNALGSRAELLRVLLRLVSEQHGVASRLIATSADIERLAMGEVNGLEALKGWRRELFGADALALMEGHLAFASDGQGLRILEQQEGGVWRERQSAS